MKFNYYILVLLLLISNISQAIDSFNLPDIGDSSGSAISPEFERRLGKAFMRNVRQHAVIIGDPEVQTYIESIGYRLASNSDDNSLKFTFFVVDNPDINAFAAPGGIIGINSGTILNSRNESELAGILAHEIAHITQRHIARQFERSGKHGLVQMTAMLAAMLLAVADPQMGSAALTVVSGASIQAQINFTRANEKEADNIGMQLLGRSGYDPHGMPDFFERLQQKTEYYQGNAPEFLRTHPLTTSRIADSKDRASKYKEINHIDSDGYKLVKSKLEVNSYKDTKDAVKEFKYRLSTTPEEQKISVRYGYILALIKSGAYHLAREQLKTLLARDKDNIAYILAAADIESEERNYNIAVNILQQAYKLYPDYKPLIFIYARALLNAQKPQQARDLLSHYRGLKNHDPAYYNLLSQAEADSGSLVNSGIAKAEYYYLTGDTKLAIKKLLHTKRSSYPNYYQREIITARLDEFKYEIDLEKDLEI